MQRKWERQDSHLVYVCYSNSSTAHGKSSLDGIENVFKVFYPCFQVANASCNLPIYFFAGKSFRENSLELVRSLIPSFLERLTLSDTRGIVMFSRSRFSSKSFLASRKQTHGKEFLREEIVKNSILTFYISL